MGFESRFRIKKVDKERYPYMIAENFEDMQTLFIDLLLLAVLSAVVIFPALGQNRHWSSHEVRHAEIVREMVESGDYLVPRLLGEVYHDKPPVMHAIAAGLTWITGAPSMLITRLPSAVAGIIGVLAVYGIGLLFFARRFALVAAIVLLAMPGYSIVARHARPDMILCASILCSCLCIGLAMRERGYAWQTCYLVLGGLCAGLGVITKGPYGILVPAFFAVFVPFRREDLTRPRFNWASFALGLLTALAIWAVPAYLRDGGHYLHGVLTQRDLDVSGGGRRKINALLRILLRIILVNICVPLFAFAAFHHTKLATKRILSPACNSRGYLYRYFVPSSKTAALSRAIISIFCAGNCRATRPIL